MIEITRQLIEEWINYSLDPIIGLVLKIIDEHFISNEKEISKTLEIEEEVAKNRLEILKDLEFISITKEKKYEITEIGKKILSSLNLDEINIKIPKKLEFKKQKSELKAEDSVFRKITRTIVELDNSDLKRRGFSSFNRNFLLSTIREFSHKQTRNISNFKIIACDKETGKVVISFPKKDTITQYFLTDDYEGFKTSLERYNLFPLIFERIQDNVSSEIMIVDELLLEQILKRIIFIKNPVIDTLDPISLAYIDEYYTNPNEMLFGQYSEKTKFCEVR